MTIRDVLRFYGYRAIRKAEAHKQKEFKMNTTDTKARFNLAAAWYLRRHDMQILKQNWECEQGTIDIVAMDNNCLVIVEVTEIEDKENAFTPEKANTAAYRTKWENLAFAYLASEPISDTPVRFDNIEIKSLDDDRCFIKHHVNALACS